MASSALPVSVRRLLPVGLGTGQSCADRSALFSDTQRTALPHTQCSVPRRCIDRVLPPGWDLLGDRSRHGACRRSTVSSAPAVRSARRTVYSGTAHGAAAEDALYRLCDGASLHPFEPYIASVRLVSGCRTTGGLFPISEHLCAIPSFCDCARAFWFSASLWKITLADHSHAWDHSFRKPDCLFPPPGCFSCFLSYRKVKAVPFDRLGCCRSRPVRKHSLCPDHRKPRQHRAFSYFFPYRFGVCRSPSICPGCDPCYSPTSARHRVYGISLAAGIFPDRSLFRAACA